MEKKTGNREINKGNDSLINDCQEERKTQF